MVSGSEFRALALIPGVSLESYFSTRNSKTETFCLFQRAGAVYLFPPWAAITRPREKHKRLIAAHSNRLSGYYQRGSRLPRNEPGRSPPNPRSRLPPKPPRPPPPPRFSRGLASLTFRARPLSSLPLN